MTCALVIDGEKIRLHGMDAPEMRQICFAAGQPFACGVVARDQLKRILGGRELACTVLDVDRYGRKVARCFMGNTDIAERLISHGWALAYRRYSKAYVPAEDEARAARLGLWEPSVEFTLPWNWRRMHK